MDRLERGVSGGFIVFDLERFTRQPKDAELVTPSPASQGEPDPDVGVSSAASH